MNFVVSEKIELAEQYPVTHPIALTLPAHHPKEKQKQKRNEKINQNYGLESKLLFGVGHEENLAIADARKTHYQKPK